MQVLGGKPPYWTANRLLGGLKSATKTLAEFGTEGEYAGLAGEYGGLIAQGTTVAEAAGATTAAGAAAGILTTIGEWFGYTGAAATTAGAWAALGGLAVAGVIVYGASNYLGGVAGDAPSAVAGANGDATARLLAGKWKLTWNWSVTYAYFTGSLSGSPGQWTYQGVLDDGSGNAIWHPAKGSGHGELHADGSAGRAGHARLHGEFPQSAALARNVDDDDFRRRVELLLRWHGRRHRRRRQARAYGSAGTLAHELEWFRNALIFPSPLRQGNRIWLLRGYCAGLRTGF